jgi:ATP-dependent DNA helicase PIF1
MIDRHIGGCTVHSWASIGTGEESVTNLVDMISMQPDALERWQVSQALIIDESTYNFNGWWLSKLQYNAEVCVVSMIDGSLFDKLEEIGRIIRGDKTPFGGLQVRVLLDLQKL